jgi:hypothetical protein
MCILFGNSSSLYSAVYSLTTDRSLHDVWLASSARMINSPMMVHTPPQLEKTTILPSRSVHALYWRATRSATSFHPSHMSPVFFSGGRTRTRGRNRGKPLRATVCIALQTGRAVCEAGPDFILTTIRVRRTRARSRRWRPDQSPQPTCRGQHGAERLVGAGNS